MSSSHSLDRIRVQFDDPRSISDAGLILSATLAEHLELAKLVDTHVDLGQVPGAANAGDKAMTVISSLLAGGDCIDDVSGLRAGRTGAVLGHRVAAPSTVGTFLRAFRWGHARQLDSVSGELLQRAWGAGAGPGEGRLTIDVDSTICETYGLKKQGGSRFTYTHVRGYHPLVAVAAGLGDVIHCRLRGGPANSGRGASSFLSETISRARKAGATGDIVVRADSGFYNHKVVEVCRRHRVRFSITAPANKGTSKAISQIPEDAWMPIPYFLPGAAVAETTYTPFANRKGKRPVRLIVRRTPPTPGSQLALLAVYDYHAFITDRAGEMLDLEADHRRHAEVENAIRDLKYGVGLNHMPSGRFGANAAWLGLNVIAHNLVRFLGRIGLGEGLITTKTIRRRHFSAPGRLTRSARKPSLHLPRGWPWEKQFQAALQRLRAVRAPLIA